MEFTSVPGEAAPSAVGRLQGMGAAELVRDLHRAGRTGILRIGSAWITKTVQFEGGRIVFADSDAPGDRLGELLVRDGVVSAEQIEAAGGSSRDLSVGSRLVEAGVLDRESLDRIVRARVSSIVADLFRAEEGEYEFREGPLPDGTRRLELSTADLILRGVRQARSFRMLRRGVGSSRARFRLTADFSTRTEGADLGDGERLLLWRLREGAVSVERLCAEVQLSNFETYQVLWALLLLGAIERDSQDLADAEARATGRLDHEEFLSILVRLCRDGETGVLHASRGAVDRTFHIREGRCVFATSTNPDDGLVAHLFRRGVISLKDREEVTLRLLTKKRVGTILLEIGALDQADVGPMVREQVLEIVNDTARWDAGEFAFTPGELPTLEEITLDCSLEDLVAQAVRRIPSWSRALSGLGGLDTRLEVSPRYLDVLDRMTLGGDEWDVVALLARPRTVREVCRATDLGDFRVCQTLWSLRILGAVAIAAPAPAQEEPVPTPAGQATESEPRVEPTPVLEEPEVEPWEAPTPIAASESQAVEPALPSVAASFPVSQAQGPTELLTLATAPTPDAPYAPPEPHVEEGSQFELAAPGCDTEPFVGDMHPDGPAGRRLGRSERSERLDLRPLDGETERQIEWLNACQQIVYRVVRAEIGAGAANFVRFCGARVPGGFGEVFAHVELADDGTWDIPGLRTALRLHAPADTHAGFRLLLEKEVEMVQVHLGPDRAEALRRKILEFERAPAP